MGKKLFFGLLEEFFSGKFIFESETFIFWVNDFGGFGLSEWDMVFVFSK